MPEETSQANLNAAIAARTDTLFAEHQRQIVEGIFRDEAGGLLVDVNEIREFVGDIEVEIVFIVRNGHEQRPTNLFEIRAYATRAWPGSAVGHPKSIEKLNKLSFH